jgi:hypothetical protein
MTKLNVAWSEGFDQKAKITCTGSDVRICPLNQTIRNRPSFAEMPAVSNAPRVAVWGVLVVARKLTLMGRRMGKYRVVLIFRIGVRPKKHFKIMKLH